MNNHNINNINEFVKYFSTHIQNYKTTKQSLGDATIVLDQYASNAFGQAIDEDGCYLLIPKHLFPMFTASHGLVVKYINGKPGLYIHVSTGSEQTLTIRIFVRKKRVNAFSYYKEIKFVPYDIETDTFDKSKQFDVDIEPVSV